MNENPASTTAGVETKRFSWSQRQFVLRARTLFYARLTFLAVGLGILSIPRWAQAFGAESRMAFFWYFVIITYSVGNFLLIERGMIGKVATFVTLCFDLIVLIYMIAYSGGLGSPMFPTQLVFTIFFAFLFPNPLAIVPPLLVLPIVAKIDTELPSRILVAEDIFTLVWYSAVNFVVVYMIVYLNGREEKQRHELLALQKNFKKMAVVEERNRLAREIHDGLGASLSSLIIQSEYLSKRAKEPMLREGIQELKSVAEESIDELRRSISMMRSDFDLVPTLEDYCYTFGERVGLDIGFRALGTIPSLAGKLQLATFRVLQESLTNAHKHARAQKVEIELVHMQGMLHLTVKDDGVGFEFRDDLEGHYGLVNMRERARQYHGTLEVMSAKGKGCQIYFTIPTVDPKTGTKWRDTLTDIRPFTG